MTKRTIALIDEQKINDFKVILREISGDDVDVEAAHQDADDVLCDLLTALGFADVVEEWRKVPKWYA